MLFYPNSLLKRWHNSGLAQLRDGVVIASLLNQAMYFGLSLGRVGTDIRSAFLPGSTQRKTHRHLIYRAVFLVDPFENAIAGLVSSILDVGTAQFERELARAPRLGEKAAPDTALPPATGLAQGIRLLAFFTFSLLLFFKRRRNAIVAPCLPAPRPSAQCSRDGPQRIAPRGSHLAD